MTRDACGTAAPRTIGSGTSTWQINERVSTNLFGTDTHHAGLWVLTHQRENQQKTTFASAAAYFPPSVFFCKSEKLTLSSHTISPRFQSGFNSKIMCPPQGFV